MAVPAAESNLWPGFAHPRAGGRRFDKEPIPIDRVDIYDPKTAHWERGPTLPTPRSEAVVLAVRNRIYVIGGTNGKDKSMTFDTLSIAQDEPAWRTEPAPPGGPVIQSSGGVIDGRIYLVAPQANSVLCYDTVVRTWDKLPSPPSAMTLWAAVCGAYKGEFWVMGGNTDNQLTFIYSPQSGTWRSRPHLPTPLGWTSAQAVDGRLILIDEQFYQELRQVLDSQKTFAEMAMAKADQ